MVPRTAYKGVVYFWDGDRQVFLAPADYKSTFQIA